MASNALRRIAGFIMRYRFTIWDMAVLLAAAVVLLVLSAEYDLLRLAGQSQARAAMITLGEVILIALILCAFLFVALRRIRAQQREVTRRRAAEQKARELAFQDVLTGLPNRRQFDEVVAAAVAAPPGVDRAHAVLMIDLNGFKAVNDVFGHPEGDEVLRAVATRLEAVVRETGDQVARLGGDEFGIIATHLRGTEDATGIALRIIAAMKDPIQVGERKHNIGIGVGIAMFPGDGKDAGEIIRRADIALYRAKSEPGSNLHFFEEEMDVQLRERALIEGELRHAVAAGDIRPYYQPMVDLKTGEIAGFEALARWRHSLLGDVPPDRFIPLAEENGLIRELSDHLLRTACDDARHWPGHTTLSFNVSAVQLRDAGFGLRVLAILGETGFAPRRLEIEISENALVRDLRSAELALGALREAGVRIALDDFGTGYSSLYHLRNFKVDRIKIDRTFVASMALESDSAAIVRALLGLGHGLGVDITAEGIESAAQRDALISEGCEHGQGFLFGRALPAAEAEALFKTAPELVATSRGV